MGHCYGILQAWAYAHGMKGVFVFMFAENMGVPWPTEGGVVAAQGLMRAGTISYWWAYFVIVSGHLSGAGLSYYLGRAGDNAFARHLSHSRRMTRARDRLQVWYSKYGPMTLLFGRLVGQVRPWSSVLAGMAGVPQLRFWLWTVIGTLIYTAIAMWCTAWGWELWIKYPQGRVPAIIAILMVFYGLALYAVISRVLHNRRKRRAGEILAAETTAQADESDDPDASD